MDNAAESGSSDYGSGKRPKKFERTEQVALKTERFIRAVRNAALIASGYHTNKGQWPKSRS